jgi:hypothetical protein
MNKNEIILKTGLSKAEVDEALKNASLRKLIEVSEDAKVGYI